jgi:hypothetical protein
MNFIDMFETLTLDGLRDFITRRQEENLHLDFKVPNSAALSSPDDKRILAKALSGFANSSGGIIVWGVDARKNAEDIDCATSERPIENVIQLLTRLNSLTGEGVDPGVHGVRHRLIEAGAGKGFILTLVPESEVGPHMAKLGDDRYYKRIGDSFYKMEHYDVADMFGRRRKPKLSVIYRINGIGANAEIVLGLKNEGRATARAPFVAYGCEAPFKRDPYGLDGNYNEGLNFLLFARQGLPWAYGGDTGVAIHPGMAHEVARLVLGFQPKSLPTQDVIVAYAVACEDQPLEEGAITISIGQLC